MKKLVISRPDLESNIKKIKEVCKESMIIGVLKGNGYGLGICEFAKVLTENGVDFFAVSELSEAKALREGGFDNEILLLTPVNDREEAAEVINLNLTATVGSLQNASLLNSFGDTVKAHIKIDTGFGRFGFDYDDTGAYQLGSFENIQYQGIYSHFSNSFGKDAEISKKQFDRFIFAAEKIKEAGINPPVRHICNSSGALRFEYAHLDAVRIGSAFLGRLSSGDTGLKRIAHLECGISEVRTLSKGSNVGYANTYRAKKEMKIAVLQAGYKDGFGVEVSRDVFRFKDILRYVVRDLRSFGKKLYIEINGKKAPVVGRISMTHLVADVTGMEVKPGDRAVLQCNPVLIQASVPREYRN